jgi:hypothetical protein
MKEGMKIFFALLLGSLLAVTAYGCDDSEPTPTCDLECEYTCDDDSVVCWDGCGGDVSCMDYCYDVCRGCHQRCGCDEGDC